MRQFYRKRYISTMRQFYRGKVHYPNMGQLYRTKSIFILWGSCMGQDACSPLGAALLLNSHNFLTKLSLLRIIYIRTKLCEPNIFCLTLILFTVLCFPPESFKLLIFNSFKKRHFIFFLFSFQFFKNSLPLLLVQVLRGDTKLCFFQAASQLLSLLTFKMAKLINEAKNLCTQKLSCLQIFFDISNIYNA